jgi:hypothetical protein
MAKRGATSTYTTATAEKICERISTGEPLLQICRDPDMPAWRTVYDWMEAHPDFAAGFARARVRGFDAIAAQCLEIADDTSLDFKPKTSAEGEVIGLTFDKEHVQRSKLRVETRLKLLAKWDPKRYGEKLDVTSDGQKLENTQPMFNITLTSE